jgi:hypothetical protein
MKNVWIGYACTYDGGMGVEKTIEKVFDDEDKAEVWSEDKEFLESVNSAHYWREYKLFNVE